MKTILVDDELLMLKRFEIECGNIEGIELLGQFHNPKDALSFAQKQRIDLAILDIEMPGMTGLELSSALRELYPDVIVIFVSAYEQYMPEAFRECGVDYYILKPYTREDVLSAFHRAKLLSRRFAKRIYIETFGRFNVYIDGRPLKFTSPDAKQLLALMVHKRGTALGNQEAFNTMWDDRNFDHTSAVSLHKALRKLKNILAEAGIENLVIQIPPSEHRINTEVFDCDFYQYLEKDPEAMRKFNGEYMADWEWGEEAIGIFLSQK